MSRRLKPELELITASKLTPHTINVRIHVMREYDRYQLLKTVYEACLVFGLEGKDIISGAGAANNWDACQENLQLLGSVFIDSLM